MPRHSDRELADKFRARVALAALSGESTPEDLAREYGLDSGEISEWREELRRKTVAGPRADAAPSGGGRRGAPSGQTPDDDFWDDDIEKTGSAVPATIPAKPVAGDPPPRAWSNKLVRPLLGRWQERHFAAKVSRELLRQHRLAVKAHPGAGKSALYLEIVRAHTGSTAAAAEAILAKAAESFASWPVERALTFQDVVHYLAVSEYLKSNEGDEAWTRENLARVVASIVPGNL